MDCYHWILGGGAAEAARLCGVSNADIADVNAHYGLGLTFAQLESSVTAPFQCSKYGDVCDWMGPTLAEQYLCDLWDDARAHLPESEIEEAAHARLEAYEDLYEAGAGEASGLLEVEETDLVVAEDPLESSAMLLASSCPTKKQVVIAGSRKVKVRAYYTLTFIYNEIGGSTKGYSQDMFGNWSKDPFGSVTIDTSYTSVGPLSGTCNTWSDEFDSDTDGFVNAHHSAWGVAANPESVESHGTYDPPGATFLSACAVRTALWNDPTCL